MATVPNLTVTNVTADPHSVCVVVTGANTVDNSPYSPLTEAHKRGDIALLHTLRSQCSYLLSLFGGNVRTACATLQGHILQVISLRTKKQMSGVDTMTNIARMAHKHSLWYRAIVRFIGIAMSKKDATSTTDYAIPHLTTSGGPFPTSIGFPNLSPKTFGKWYTFHANTSYKVAAMPKDVPASLRLCCA